MSWSDAIKIQRMAFWCRIKQSKLISFPTQFKRCYFQIPRPCLVLNHTAASNPRTWLLQNPTPSFIHKTHIEFNPNYYNNVRFFGRKIQFKKKKEEVKKEEEPRGPLLNEQITAEFVRVVTEDGKHGVVSTRKALERARSLNLDLVQVQRDGKPPVCKFMDYNYLKYKLQKNEKNSAKSKSEVTLRKGDCKEVRFSGKTEQKDLEMKANSVKKLMERGYRVKCMAMGTEDQDLGGLLSRLSALIEDVSIVESGPRVEKRQAYVIVRHVMFGPSKKGKSSKVVGATTSPDEVQNAATLPPPTGNRSVLDPIPFLSDEEILNLESGGLEADGENEILSKMQDKKDDGEWSASFDANDDFDLAFDSRDAKYGIFSAPPKVNDDNPAEEVNRYKKKTPIFFDSTTHPYKPPVDSVNKNIPSSNMDGGGKGKWGIFSGERAGNFKSQAKVQR